MKNIMKKVLLLGAGFIAITLILYLIAGSLVYPPEYIRRAILWGESDVYDYQKFPERKIEPGDDPFKFEINYEDESVQAFFEADPKIDDLDSFLAETKTQAFLVIHNDRIIYERYFNGVKRDSIVTSFSVAKSFTSALVGIAIHEGYIGSVEDPITLYLPELEERDVRFKNITIRDLLMMASGINYSDVVPLLHDDGAKTYYYPDLRDIALHGTHIAGHPGEHFLYNNYHPLLLGMILERSTGMTVAGYLEQKIWKPVGMEYAGSWSLDNPESGFEKMESGINARAVDFAKLGRLFLNQGVWNGSDVIPTAWITESTEEDKSIQRENYYPADEFFTKAEGYYKYMWWGLPRSGGVYDYSAAGKYGQFIYVSPEANLIIVRNGEKYGIEFADWLQVFYRFASSIAK